MIFNQIEIYQRSKKTQHVNWPDPAQPDFFQKIKLIRPVRSEPEPEPPAGLPPLSVLVHFQTKRCSYRLLIVQ
jgi:hypothetical protein